MTAAAKASPKPRELPAQVKNYTLPELRAAMLKGCAIAGTRTAYQPRRYYLCDDVREASGQIDHRSEREVPESKVLKLTHCGHVFARPLDRITFDHVVYALTIRGEQAAKDEAL